MHVIQLLPQTKRLKQLIKDHGDVWLCISLPHPMQCFNNDEGVRIESLDGTHCRNVRLDAIIPCNKANTIV